MEEVKLANGFEIPQIGYGTYPQKESLLENVKYAYQEGYRLFDTSDNYSNEAYLGEALNEIKKTGINTIVISKYSSPGNEARFKKMFSDSNDRLKGTLNVYLLHWPYPFLWRYQWRQLEKLYIEGKVKAIGVCNFEINKLKKLVKKCSVCPMINQIERHPLFQQNDLVDFCKEHNIKIMCYSPIARANNELMNNPILLRIADKYKKTVGQVILRWDIDTGTIPIPGASSKKHISDNINVFDFKLTNDDINQINKLDEEKRTRYDPKTRFNRKEKAYFFIIRAMLFLGIKRNIK